jgi:uncharacterized protein YcbK (DUF882 family)
MREPKDDQAAGSFAFVLAGAVHSHAHAFKPAAPKPKDGTSELDKPDAEDDTKDAKDAGDSNGTTPTDDAAANSASSSAAAANGVVRSVGALDPALQAKLARVIARVREETGHDVTVAETVRSQSRQNTLFAQGRETAGPVVTWTQNSKHTQGRAVDLLLDGGAAGSDAYATLQRIAGEEGLRTLGARDPGHLELPGTGTNGTSHATTPALPAEPADASGPGQVSIARLAQVAQVADVKIAAPAQVARVAPVAQTGHVLSVSGQSAAQGSSTDTSSNTSSDSRDGGSNGDGRGGYGSLGPAFALRDYSSAQGAVASVGTGSTAAERTERVMAAIDSAPVRPLSQITMSVDAGNGATDRIHVALRGTSLNTTIDAADPRAAQVMTARSDELVKSLTRDGLEVESLRVRAASTTAAIVTPTAQGTSNSSTGSRFERGNPWQQSDRQQSQNERRQQQRDQRRGQEQ